MRVRNIKVLRRTRNRTHLQRWETYWFGVEGKDGETWGITKQDGVFRFYRKNCKTLREAKQHIVDELERGTHIRAL